MAEKASPTISKPAKLWDSRSFSASNLYQIFTFIMKSGFERVGVNNASAYCPINYRSMQTDFMAGFPG